MEREGDGEKAWLRVWAYSPSDSGRLGCLSCRLFGESGAFGREEEVLVVEKLDAFITRCMGFAQDINPENNNKT